MRVADESPPGRKADVEAVLAARKKCSTTARSIVTMAQDKPGNPIQIRLPGPQTLVVKANLHAPGRAGGAAKAGLAMNPVNPSLGPPKFRQPTDGKRIS